MSTATDKVAGQENDAILLSPLREKGPRDETTVVGKTAKRKSHSRSRSKEKRKEKRDVSTSLNEKRRENRNMIILLRHPSQAVALTLILLIRKQIHSEKVQRNFTLEVNKYKLIQSLADYANQYSSQYVPEREIKEKILIGKPVPDNIHPVKTLHEFARDMMKKKNPHDLIWDGVLEKVSKSVRDVMDPLSKSWLTLDEAFKTTVDSVSINIEELTEHIKQAVLLLGQAINTTVYHRRVNALLNTGSSSSDTTTILHNQADLLKTPNAELFGGEFLKKMQKLNKDKKDGGQIFTNSASLNRKASSSQPFRNGPSSRGWERGGGQQFVLRRKGKNNDGYQKSNNNDGYQKTNGKYKFVTGNVKNVHPVLKRLFGNEIIPNVPLAGRLKHFTRAWKILTSDPEILSVVEGYQVPLISPPVQEHIPFSPIMSSAQERLVDVEVSRINVEERSHYFVYSPNRGVHHQFVFSGQKRWRSSPSHEPQTSQSVCNPISTSKWKVCIT